MKVVHITHDDYQGAGLCVIRIHRALLGIGIDSKVLVAEKQMRDSYVYEVVPSGKYKHWRPNNTFLRKTLTFLRSIGVFANKKDKAANMLKKVPYIENVTWNSPITDYDLLQNEYVQQADIIHLHWVANFLDYETFFKGINKPVIWTLHDQNIAFGGFHYQIDYDRAYWAYKPLEDMYADIKQKAISDCKSLHLIALSSMMEDFLRSKPLLNQYSIDRIYNAVEYERYKPIEKSVARRILNIPGNKKIVAFCAYRIWDPRKRLIDLVKAIEYLNTEDKYGILCIGGGGMPCETSVPTYFVGEVQSPELMSMVYSAADYFAMPSMQEVFAQTPMEAMACGLPVVAYPCSGAYDLINEQNGVVCDDFTVQALKDGMIQLERTKYDSQYIRQNMIDNYSPKKIAQQYLEVYKKYSTQN